MVSFFPAGFVSPPALAFLALALAAALAFLALAALDPPLPSAVLAGSAKVWAVLTFAFLRFPLVFFLEVSYHAPLRVTSTVFLSVILFRTTSLAPKILTLDSLAPVMIAFRKLGQKILAILALISLQML